MKIAICGYDEQEKEAVEKYIRRYCSEQAWDFQIDRYSSPEELQDCFSRGLYHIVFLELCSRGKEGIQAAQKIRSMDEHLILIFITPGDDEYFEDGYQLGVLNYIVRPVEEGSVRSSIRRSSKYIGELKQTLEIMAESTPVKITAQDIQYIEGKKNISIIHTNQFLVKTPTPLNELERQLPERRFLRSHERYLVNMDAISHKAENYFNIINGDEIPISSSLKKTASDTFDRYKCQCAQR